MAKVPEMTPEFAQWYSDAFMDEGATRETRWKGVVEVSAKPTLPAIEVLVRLAYPTNVPAMGTKNEALADTYASVTTALSGNDPLFFVGQSGRELQVLAAATLERMF